MMSNREIEVGDGSREEAAEAPIGSTLLGFQDAQANVVYPRRKLAFEPYTGPRGSLACMFVGVEYPRPHFFF